MFDHNHFKNHGPFVTSDSDRLVKVIIHPINTEQKHVIPRFGYLGQPGFSADILGSSARSDHKLFVQTLLDLGIEVLYTYDLINNALDNLKKAGQLDIWLSHHFPLLTTLIDSGAHIDAHIDALDLIGASDRSYYTYNSDRELQSLTKPLAAMYYTRDLAVMLPEGVVLTSFDNKRTDEAKIARLMFEHSDKLKDYPIVFDAIEEGVLLQGGDLVVLDENTLIIGIDNMTQRKTAELLAQKLNKLVIGVVLPKSIMDKTSPFSSLFLHLDTVFNLVDKKKLLVVPYFFESRFTLSNPIYSILGGVRNNLSKEMQVDLTKVINNLKEVGNIVTFDPGSGIQSELDIKLVDYMKMKFGYEIIYVGGDIPESFEDQVKHMVEIIMPEIRFQAGNVVVTKPGHVMMYMNNTTKTHEALIKAGIHTIPVEGTELARWNGGPHCMTLPLVRK